MMSAMDVIEMLGGPTAVARLLGCKAPSVIEWRRRGIPAERCPAIELATQGRVTVRDLRPDVSWARIPDSTWPHADGRPVIDVARPVAERGAA